MSNNMSENKLTRLCHVIKRDDFDGYGFNLHAEKGKPGQYIGKVDDNSPAEAAGLRQGDRIIEVNGVNIGNETHKQVVQRIKAIACEVRLLVVDPTLVSVSNNNRVIDGNSSIASESSTTVSPDIDSKSPNATNNSMTNASANSIDSTDATNNTKPMTNGNGNGNDTNGNQSPTSATNHKLNQSSQMNSSSASMSSPDKHQTANNSNNESKHQSGDDIGLNLKMTAAELRAKLAAKKKYDPKNDSVDLRKKYEIVQKL